MLGGSLDAAGSQDSGYVLRHGRMLESEYVCMFDMYGWDPVRWTRHGTVMARNLSSGTMALYGRRRAHGCFATFSRQSAPAFGLSERHILTLERLVI